MEADAERDAEAPDEKSQNCVTNVIVVSPKIPEEIDVRAIVNDVAAVFVDIDQTALRAYICSGQHPNLTAEGIICDVLDERLSFRRTADNSQPLNDSFESDESADEEDGVLRDSDMEARLVSKFRDDMYEAYAQSPAPRRRFQELSEELQTVFRHYFPVIKKGSVVLMYEYALTMDNFIFAAMTVSNYRNAADAINDVYQRLPAKQLFPNRKNEAARLFVDLKLPGAYTDCLSKSCVSDAAVKAAIDRFEKESTVVVWLRCEELPFSQFTECMICAESRPIMSFIECRPTVADDTIRHAICRECVENYSRATITSNYVATGGCGLKCVEAGCLGVLLQSHVLLSISSKRLRAQLERLLTRESLRASKLPVEECESARVRCKRCSNAQMFDDPPAIYRVFDCRKCGCQFCRICKQDWKRHIGKRCDEIVIETEEERLRHEIEEKLVRVHVRYCTKCNLAFEKSFGCNKMVCRCGNWQCYICNESISQNTGYLHFCIHSPYGHQSVARCTQCNKCLLDEDPQIRERRNVETLLAQYANKLPADVLQSYRI